MPRKQKDPIIDVMNYFETVPIDAAKLALVVVGGIVQRRSSTAKDQRMVKVRDRNLVAPETSAPLRSRAEEAVAEEPNPLDPKPRTARVRRPRVIQEQVTPLLPGPVATVGE